MSYSNNTENIKDTYTSREDSGAKGLIIFLLLVSILTNLGMGYYLSMSNTKNSEVVASAVMEKYLANEYQKAGGKDNYDLLAKAQQLQMEDQIPQIKQFIASKDGVQPATASGAAAATDTVAAKTLTQDEIAAIKKTAYIEGNKDAIITLVEYSDLECPFCIRQYPDKTIEKIHEKFGDQVNSAFKNFRGVPHENAEIEASATLCAGDLGGTDAYVAYYKAIFTRSKGGNGTGFSKDALVPLAKELKIDGTKFQACLDSKKNIARFDAETAEGVKLGVQGTPGTVVINNKTGAYELIAGAYPASKFEEVINRLLAK